MAKNRKKRNSILNFVAVAVLTIVGIVLCVGGIHIPYTDYVFNGFARSISLGLDLSGGVYVVYECQPNDGVGSVTDDAIQATISRLEAQIGKDYSEAVIQKQSGNKIRVEVPHVENTDEVLKKIGEPTPLYIGKKSEDSENVEPEIVIVGTDVKDVQVQGGEHGGYAVRVEFTSAAASKFSQLTKDVSESNNQYIYMYLGEVDNPTKSMKINCKEQISGGTTLITAGDNQDFTLEEAEDYRLTIMSGTYNVKLKFLESNHISATLGANALKYCLIGGAIGMLLIFVIMFWRYGDFGLLANLALVIYLILMLFFLQAISFVQLTLPGLAGIVLSIGMAVDGTVIIFERVREEYRSGKKLPLAAKSAFKRAFWPIFDSNITTIITAVVLYILGTASIQGFAITLLIGIVLSMFMNLVIMRFLVKWYLPLNSVNGKKLHLPKQVRQFKDDVVGAGTNSSLATAAAGVNANATAGASAQKTTDSANSGARIYENAYESTNVSSRANVSARENANNLQGAQNAQNSQNTTENSSAAKDNAAQGGQNL